ICVGIYDYPDDLLLYLFYYEVIKVITKVELGPDYLLSFFLYAILAAVLGFVLGFLFSVMANRGMFPEYLKSPIILSAVLLCFVMAELIMNETGMLAVT